MSVGKVRNTERLKFQCHKIKVNWVEGHRVHGEVTGRNTCFFFNQTLNDSRSNIATIRIKSDGNKAR